jgi:hypothetical protein
MANALLRAIASRTTTGETAAFPPGQFAAEARIPTSAGVARAVRALLSRGRLEKDGTRYRLLDARPIRPSEPPKPRGDRGARARSPRQRPTHEDLGRTIIDRLISLHAETKELRTGLERSRSEAEAATREASVASRKLGAAERRVEMLEARNRELEQRLSMTEANLKTVVEAARTTKVGRTPEDQAVLDLLKGSGRSRTQS